MNELDMLRIDLYGQNYDVSNFKITNMVGTSLQTAGLKISKVKQCIKKYCKDDLLNLDDFPLAESVELTLCYFSIGLLRCKSFDEQMRFLDKNLKYADSWIITDHCPQYIKKSTYLEYKPYFLKFSKSKEEYKRRFSYVYLIKFYKDIKVKEFEEYIFNDERYYVYMAEAWMLATFAIFDEEGVFSYLNKENADVKLKRKTISKMCDSYRINKEIKEKFKALR